MKYKMSVIQVTDIGLIPQTLGPLNVFILLNGWICLHGVLD